MNDLMTLMMRERGKRMGGDVAGGGEREEEVGRMYNVSRRRGARGYGTHGTGVWREDLFVRSVRSIEEG